MDINFNHKIDAEQMIHQYLQSLDDVKSDAIRHQGQSPETLTPAIKKVNVQLKEVINQIQTAQNEITKNQILQYNLNQIQSLLSQYSQSDVQQVISQINTIISNTKFTNEPLLSPIQENYNLQELSQKISVYLNTALNNITAQIKTITKANISLENIIASNSEIPSDNFVSLNDIITKIKKELLKSGTETQSNINSAAVFELTK